jgi:L,D-transpeptidase catalytic domain
MKRATLMVAALLAVPTAAHAQATLPTPPTDTPAPQQQPPGGRLSIALASGIGDSGKRFVGKGQRILVRGRVRPYVAGERYTVELFRKGRKIADHSVEATQDGSSGKFTVAFKVRGAGSYRLKARHDASANQGAIRATARSFRALSGGAGRSAKRRNVRLLQRGLRLLGFVTPYHGRFDSGTARAVLAYRKTNGMARTTRANPTVFRMLLRGAGGFRLRYPKAGKHVEYDLSRQVLVLARNGRPERVYHSSSGAPSTPTVLGSFRFYRKSPGTNAKGMVHSSYFIRGYAIHGYHSVPTHPASHGCLRVPIPNAASIFRWVDIGDRIFVYR